MKEYIKQVLSSRSSQVDAKLCVREYLQARILQQLQDSGAFTTWAFQGGTALRFLYSMPRFSEDLDFALVAKGADDGFRKRIARVVRMFEAETYAVSTRISDRKAVKSAFIQFPGLLYELGLSPRSREKLSVKIDIDSNPPDGAMTTTTIVRRHVTLNLRHYDKASLLAGKLHALLQRAYTKGRDLYDLVWYLADRSWPSPNFVFLTNALEQTGWSGPEVTSGNWRKLLRRHLDNVDWKQAADDVRPFLQRPEEIALINRESVFSLLSGPRRCRMRPTDSRAITDMNAGFTPPTR